MIDCRLVKSEVARSGRENSLLELVNIKNALDNFVNASTTRLVIERLPPLFLCELVVGDFHAVAFAHQVDDGDGDRLGAVAVPCEHVRVEQVAKHVPGGLWYWRARADVQWQPVA